MNLGKIYNIVQAQTGKDQFGGYIAPDRFNDALMFVNYTLFNKYADVVEATSEISDDLIPFIVTMGDNENVPMDISPYGYGQLPNDFVRQVRAHVYGYNNLNCTTSERVPYMVTIMSNDKFNGRIARRGRMLKPRLTDPIGTIQNGQLYIQPIGYTKCIFTYLRQPITPVFGYTIVDDEPVYDPSTSIELEWPEQVHNAFTEMVIDYFAVVFRSEFNLQTANPDKP